MNYSFGLTALSHFSTNL